jgi:hypothetical protein
VLYKAQYDITVFTYKANADGKIEVVGKDEGRQLPLQRVNPLKNKKALARLDAMVLDIQSQYKTLVVRSDNKLSVQELYDSRAELVLPKPTVTVVCDHVGLQDIVLRDGDPPEYASLGLNSGVWNTAKDQCLNAFLAYLKGTHGFKTLTRESFMATVGKALDDPVTVGDVQLFCTTRKITVYMLDAADHLIWKNATRSAAESKRVMFVKINDGNVYPITDAETRSQIAHGHRIVTPVVDWEKHQHLELLQDTKQVTSHMTVEHVNNDYGVHPCANLNDFVHTILVDEKSMCEYLRLSPQGNILSCATRTSSSS